MDGDTQHPITESFVSSVTRSCESRRQQVYAAESLLTNGLFPLLHWSAVCVAKGTICAYTAFIGVQGDGSHLSIGPWNNLLPARPINYFGLRYASVILERDRGEIPSHFTAPLFIVRHTSKKYERRK